jgi:hypothetical protein
MMEQENLRKSYENLEARCIELQAEIENKIAHLTSLRTAQGAILGIEAIRQTAAKAIGN